MKDTNYYKNQMAKILNSSLENNPLLARELISAIFEDDELIIRSKMICDAYQKDEYKNSTLVIKSIKVNALIILKRICEREQIGFIPLFFKNERKDFIYKSKEEIKVLILSKQEREFMNAYFEALILSGDMGMTDMKYFTMVSKRNPNKNPVIISGLPKEYLKPLTKEISLLPPMLKIPLFVEKEENKVTLAFFDQTEPVTVITKEDDEFLFGPFPALDIFACSLLKSILRNSLSMEYKETKELNEILLQRMEMELLSSDLKYLIPCEIKKNGEIFPIFEQSIPTEDLMIKYEIINSVKKQLLIPNRTFTVVDLLEYSELRAASFPNAKNTRFLQSMEIPPYTNPERAAKSILFDKLNEEMKEIREGLERDSIIVEIHKEKQTEISLARIINAIIERKSDWEAEIFKDPVTKSVEKNLTEQFAEVSCEYKYEPKKTHSISYGGSEYEPPEYEEEIEI